MKTIRDPSQQRLYNPFEGVIGKTGLKQIQTGWQSMFRDLLLEQLPIARFGKGLSEHSGRPTFELHAVVGLLLIREFFGWTVPQAHEALLFRADIQYALNLEPGVDVTQRTLERHLKRMQDDEGLGQELFATLTDTLLQSLEVKVKTQRLDSTHILSDMSNMGRARMIGTALKRFIAKVEKEDSELLSGLPEELLTRYQKSSDSQIFGDLHKTEARQIALQQAAEDLAEVLVTFANVEPISAWKDYQQLQTIFNQQCEVREEFIEVRKKTGGNVIQNVSDPDATFCGNKGPGYQVQISETYNEDGDPNFITSAIVETACESDADAMVPVLDDLKSRDLLPEDLLADAGYGSQENIESAASESVILTAPVPGGKKFDPDEIGYDQFKLNDENKVESCPAGHAPKTASFSEKTQRTNARMDAETCAACPLLQNCRVRLDKETGKPNGRVQFNLDALKAESRRRYEQTDEFRDRYRWRAGIEGINSCLKRKMGLGRLRVRGMKAVKLAVMLKLTGWNILRAVALRTARAKTLKPA